MKRNLFLYVFVLIILGLGIFFTLERGQRLPPRPVAAASAKSGARVAVEPVSRGQTPATPPAVLAADAHGPLINPLSRLFIQLIVVLVATRVMGRLFSLIGQPAVVGEMFAGILLGPSLLGAIFPQGFQWVFAASSLGHLRMLSQIGVCLFMFAVGMQLDLSKLRGRAQTAVVVSHVGIIFPYFLGVMAALILFPTLAGEGTSFLSFALFMGIATSITAFPVLARILQERGLASTPLGATAITCAAVDDITAWSLLAFVVAIARASGLSHTLFGLLLSGLFVASMLMIIRPRLPQWLKSDEVPGAGIAPGTLTAVLVFVFGSALVTEQIGVHALFGSFLAGVVMPNQREFREQLKVRIESFSSIFLLPLFFAFTGLRTQVGLINTAEGWWFCLLIIGIATLGKLGGCMMAARFTGMAWRDAFALGALMNTRGLMELIAINIGYDLGILSPQIFAMLVLMALVTTFMTGPLLAWAYSPRHKTETAAA